MTIAFAPIVTRPSAIGYEVLLTAMSGVSHHDPAVQDDSNRTLFNRQKQLLSGDFSTALPGQSQIDDLTVMLAVPAGLAELMADLSLAEFVAAALVRVFLDAYNGRNGGEGEGLFSGMDRYGRLEARARLAAIGAPGLRSWWSRLTSSLGVGVHPGADDALLLRLLTVPKGLQHLILRALSADTRSIVAVGRYWHDQLKLVDATYAKAAKREHDAEPVRTLRFAADEVAVGSREARVLEVPAVTGNSLRHQIVREPGWWHLAQALDLPTGVPGTGMLPPGVESIFYNGGNIRSGAKQPSNPHLLAWQIRERFPLLDLVGGVTDSFDLGEGRLIVQSVLVCRENEAALRGHPELGVPDSPALDLAQARISAFDLLDDVTLTRQAGTGGEGQMIYSFETLVPGAAIVARLTLRPFTPILSRGALEAAVTTFLTADQTIGGQAARGFGHMRGDWLVRPPDDSDEAPLEAYEAYLAGHGEALRSMLIDGTLGAQSRVVS